MLKNSMSARVLDQTCFLMMAGYWVPFFSEFLWTSHLSWSIRTPKKNLANIKPPC